MYRKNTARLQAVCVFSQLKNAIMTPSGAFKSLTGKSRKK
jgi:hypothetical protein